MKFTTFCCLVIATFGVDRVYAHTRVWSLHVNGVDQGAGAGKYIRQPPNTDPVKDLWSDDVRCNVNGYNAVPSYVSVLPGDVIEPEWYRVDRGDDIIADSHLGPIVTYIAPANTNGEGNVWVKIAEEGFDQSTGKWAIIKLRENGGKHKLTIPRSLASGDYLLRVEILALHEADALTSKNAARGIQLYPSCSQIKVNGNGTTVLPAGAAIPGIYSDNTPGIYFDLYDGSDPARYAIPGPPIWNGVGAPAKPTPAPISSRSTVSCTTSTPTPTPTSAPLPSAPQPTVPPRDSSIALPSVAPPSSSTIPLPTTTPSLKTADGCWRDFLDCLNARTIECTTNRDICLGSIKIAKRSHYVMQKRRGW